MHGYLKGYYGYKNFGDELLLLWLIPWLFEHHHLTQLSIESADVIRLYSRLTRHSDLVHLQPYLQNVHIVPKHSVRTVKPDVLFLGGGEVLTDGRPFPYNGRNYLLRYGSRISNGNYHLLGGVGTPKKFLSSRLRKKLLSNARSVTVREQRSFEIAMRYVTSEKITLYHDFALDVLRSLERPVIRWTSSKQLLLNVNPYIRSDETKKKIQNIAKKNTWAKRWFFPAERGTDERYMQEISNFLPDIQVIDRTTMTVQEIIEKVAPVSFGIAARLHVLLILRFLQIPFEPLIYQEKITTFLETCFDDSSSS